MASMTKMAAAAKLAEERIRVDIGDDMSVEDEVKNQAIVLRMRNCRMATNVRSILPFALRFALSILRHSTSAFVCVFPQDLGISYSTTGTQTDPVSFDSRLGGRASRGDPEPLSPQNNRETMTAAPR